MVNSIMDADTKTHAKHIITEKLHVQQMYHVYTMYIWNVTSLFNYIFHSWND